MTPNTLERMMAAACAVAFAVVALSALINYGDHTVRVLAIAAAVDGCICQFTFQGGRRAQILSLCAAAVGFLLAIAALLLFSFST